MADIFCCRSNSPYRPKILDHEAKFRDFIRWERHISDIPGDITASSPSALLGNFSAYAIQVVRQVNYGPIKWKRYFVSNGIEQGGSAYKEVAENDLIDSNYEKLNTYKNFKCAVHNLFFELNIYKMNPANEHHWRVNIARPVGDIDLNPGGFSPSLTAQPLLVKTSEETKNILQANNEDKKDEKEDEKEDEKKDEKDEKKDEEKEGGVKEDKVGSEGKDNGSGVPGNSLLFERIESDGDYDNYDDRDYRSAYGYDSESESERDYTACSAHDCGYCGKCDY